LQNLIRPGQQAGPDDPPCPPDPQGRADKKVVQLEREEFMSNNTAFPTGGFFPIHNTSRRNK